MHGNVYSNSPLIKYWFNYMYFYFQGWGVVRSERPSIRPSPSLARLVQWDSFQILGSVQGLNITNNDTIKRYGVVLTISLLSILHNTHSYSIILFGDFLLSSTVFSLLVFQYYGNSGSWMSWRSGTCICRSVLITIWCSSTRQWRVPY